MNRFFVCSQARLARQAVITDSTPVTGVAMTTVRHTTPYITVDMDSPLDLDWDIGGGE